jgi:hypothetical protein
VSAKLGGTGEVVQVGALGLVQLQGVGDASQQGDLLAAQALDPSLLPP